VHITMKHTLSLFVLYITLHLGLSIFCYTCSNDPDSPIYAVSCGDVDPDSDAQSCTGCSACTTSIYNDGKVMRGFSNDASVQDGDCDYQDMYLRCFCTDMLCNTDLCDNCNGL
ncbi:unnamed protein product, partial [Meganyctiphanes norvegica]